MSNVRYGVSVHEEIHDTAAAAATGAGERQSSASFDR
jgi:hypothetical protein